MATVADFGADSLAKSAAAQQTCIITALYFDRRDVVERLLGSDGEILAWVHQPDSWPPSYTVIASGGAYLLAVAGTSNLLVQPPWHIAGTWARSGVLPGVATNGQWSQASAAVWAAVRPLLPSNLGGETLRLSGHSYGGALVELLALQRAADTPGLGIQAMTLGGARPCTPGYGGAVPTMWHLFSTGDIVYYLPQAAELLPFYNQWTEPLVSTLAGPSWQHYGKSVILGPLGVGSSIPAPDPLPPYVALDPVGQHSLLNYAGRQLAAYPGGVGPADVIAPLSLALSCWGPSVQSLAFGLPATGIGPDGLPFTVPYYLGVPAAPSSPEGAIMGYPVPLTNGTPYRVVRKKNLPDGGCSDTFTLWVSGEDQAAQEKNLKTAIAKVNLAMKTAESSEVVSIQNRASIIGQPRSGKSYYFDDGVNLGNGLASTPASLTNVSYDIKVQSATGGSVGNMKFRGLPQSVTQVAAGGADQTAVPPSVTALCAALKAAVVTQPQNNTLGAIAAMRVVDSNPATNPLRAVRVFGLNSDGYLTVAVTTPVIGLTRGDFATISLDAEKKACLTGISGTYRVIDVSTTVDPTVYTLNKKVCCPTDLLLQATGSIRKVVYIYTAVGGYAPFSVGTRDTGKGGFSRAGRRKGRCC